VKWVEASGKDMDRISNLSTPPGIMAVLAMPDQAKLPPVNNHHRHLFLDNVSDPGNVGGILRTADWFGIKSVILGPGTAEWTNPKVVQASMGSIFRLRMQYASFEEAVQALRDVPWMAADMDGRDTVSFVWPSQGVLVLGSESHGLSPDIRSRVASLVTIPKSATGGAESLNVGVATGILLNAWTRSGLQ
jgi:TrmH family RNA methyltransferase